MSGSVVLDLREDGSQTAAQKHVDGCVRDLGPPNAASVKALDFSSYFHAA